VIRWAWLFSLVCLCACQQLVTSDQPTPTSTVLVRTDLTLLAERITLPGGIESDRWSVVPLGTIGGAAPGPADTRLYALLQPYTAAAANLKVLAPAKQQQTSATMPPSLARELMPAQALATLQPDPVGDLLLPGDRYDPNRSTGLVSRRVRIAGWRRTAGVRADALRPARTGRRCSVAPVLTNGSPSAAARCAARGTPYRRTIESGKVPCTTASERPQLSA
jgi:hypothetical protein